MKRRKKKKLPCLLHTAALAYLGAITPRLIHRPQRASQIYYAHRGLHDNESEAPENTLAAFKKAVDQGYGIELDVQLTKDGQVVVAHDFTLKRNCGVNLDIDTLTYEELQRFPVFKSNERIPLFTDVLKVVDGKVPLIVELKYKNGSKICEKADAILQQYHGDYVIESFHPQAVFWYRKNRPDICRGQLSSNYDKDGDHSPIHWAMRHLLTNFLTAPDFIAYNCRDKKALSKNICRILYGIPCYAWTIKSQEELEACRGYFDYFIFEGFIPEDTTN